MGCGIIPARAGFTGAGGAHPPAHRDHPRSRGVYSEARPASPSRAGSSPLARGLHDDEVGVDGGHGIIPARAGFTSGTCSAPPNPPDHPRSRGVYPPTAATGSPAAGSSPLARGLLELLLAGHARSGIIPARAGFTRRRRGQRPRPRDHPRSRGVYVAFRFVFRVCVGSSPLARGLPRSQPLLRSGGGIIPARAGFTANRGHVPGRDPDHPRSRGVYAALADAVRGVRGSSPLARGLRGFPAAEQVLPRIIPARAGFTRASRFAFRLCADHPRSRGVYR